MTAKILEAAEMIYRCCHTYLLRLFRKSSEAQKPIETLKEPVAEG
jgi:hypothetical protein